MILTFKDRLQFADVLLTVGLNFKKGQALIAQAEGEATEMIDPLFDLAEKRGASQTILDRRRLPCPALPSSLLDQAGRGECTLISLSAPYTKDPADKAGCHLTNDRLQLAYDQGKMPYVKSVYPTPGWAARVYPDLDHRRALDMLCRDFLFFSYLDSEDAVAHWRRQQERQASMKRILDELALTSVHFEGSGNDCHFQLIDGGRWLGGSASHSLTGSPYLPNIPSVEIFTVPKRGATSGILRSSKPLVYEDELIEGIELEFSQGRVIRASAEKGKDLLRKILDLDCGASYLGELALVPVSSRIGLSGRLFFNTLLDENAACHVALGRGTPAVLPNSYLESRESLLDKGINDSSIHLDIVVGTEELEVKGIDRMGKVRQLMHKGEWALEVDHHDF